MYRVIAVAVLALLFACPGLALAKPGKEKPVETFQSTAELLKWINGYRHDPEPKRVPDAVKAMSAFGATKDMDQAGVYIGFVAGVLGANPDTAEDLVAKMFPLPPEDQVLIIKAIAYSGLPGWKKLLPKFVERMPARKDLIDKFLFGAKPVLTELKMQDDSSVIDLNWGYYFATGWEAPVRRIVAALAFSLDKNKVETLTIGAMAKWTLAQNASRDNDLLLMLKKISTDVEPATRKPLGRSDRCGRDARAWQTSQGRAGVDRRVEGEGFREFAQLQLVGTGGPDRAGLGLRRSRCARSGRVRHSVRCRRRGFHRSAQISGADRISRIA